MALKTLIREWLGARRVVYECRNCGTTLDEAEESCPACGSDDVVTHELE